MLRNNPYAIELYLVTIGTLIILLRGLPGGWRWSLNEYFNPGHPLFIRLAGTGFFLTALIKFLHLPLFLMVISFFGSILLLIISFPLEKRRVQKLCDEISKQD